MFSDYQLPIFSCFFLFIAMLGYWVSLAFPKNKTSFTLSRVTTLFSNLLFGLTLIIRWWNEGYFPLSNLYESLIFLSWGISTIHLFVEFRTQSRLIGAISAPIIFFISGFSSLTLPIEMQKALPLVPSLQSNWLMMHVSMMMVSYATLIIGSLLSILYLAFTLFKKKKVNVEKTTTNILTVQQSSISSQSPILQTIDIWSYRIIGLGFPFLTIGIISGAVWANEAWGSYWSWDPKETWALITWLIFAVYLHSRLLKGWQGTKAASLGSCGFFVIWICYLGVNFLGKGLHSYGWVL
jgi:cytochrome c-type biogenesis protein CcsB|tara:strand:+ start:113 stop:997 length:885 start_codon:yes stop_codon:yes gene_type:complete